MTDLFNWREEKWAMPETLPMLTPPIAIDLETYDPALKQRGPGWAFSNGHIVGIAVATKTYTGYFPIRHVEGGNLDVDQVLSWARTQFKQPGPKIFANATYDLGWLRRENVLVEGDFHDVQLQAPLIDETMKSFSLDALGKKFLGRGKDYTELDSIAKMRAIKNIGPVIHLFHSSYIGRYAEQDAQLTLDLWHLFNGLLNKDNLLELYDLERTLIPMLLQMRWKGVLIDLDRTEQIIKLMKNRKENCLEEISSETGIRPDLWAAESVAKVFDAIGVSYPRTPKINAPSFQKEWLEAHPHPIAQLIMEARKVDKYCSTFLEGYLLGGNHKGRIHAQFNQLRSDDSGTVSGRFSSSNPNLQNIPERDPDWGSTIRSLFLPEPGEQWWKFDWSQIEYRLIVHFAYRMKYRGAKEAVQKYRKDITTDYHQVIADLTNLDRKSAKTLNFGLAYGQGITLLCKNLGVGVDEGTQIINEYHRKAPFIREISNACSNKARKSGTIRTILNRRRRFDLWELDGKIVSKGTAGARRAFTHKALNALIQGSAADIMKKAMSDIWKSGICDILGSPLLTVHDELDGSTPGGDSHNEALRELGHIMENCVKLEVPLLVDGEIGTNWGNLKAMEK